MIRRNYFFLSEDMKGRKMRYISKEINQQKYDIYLGSKGYPKNDSCAS